MSRRFLSVNKRDRCGEPQLSLVCFCPDRHHGTTNKNLSNKSLLKGHKKGNVLYCPVELPKLTISSTY